MTPLVRKILRSKNLRFGFRSLKRESALAQIDGNLIEIDLKRSTPPVRNLLHEALHYFYPDMPHKEVYKMEAEEWKKLNNKEANKLYKKLFR
jgi:hypothetical protein